MAGRVPAGGVVPGVPPDLTFDPASLQEALAGIPAGAFSLPSTFSGTGVHHGYRRLTLVSAGFHHEFAGVFADVLAAFAPVYEAWISDIAPGGFIVPHRDAGPWRERWQVPIAAGGSFQQGVSFRPSDGKAFRVEHFEKHSVINDSPHDRVHIVLDRDVFLPFPAKPFELFPIPPEFDSLIASA